MPGFFKVVHCFFKHGVISHMWSVPTSHCKQPGRPVGLEDGVSRQFFGMGGIPGLKKGDGLLPPQVSGTDRTLVKYLDDSGDEYNRPDKVYVTTERNTAKLFASAYPHGALYRVEPRGELELDPDNPDSTSWMCDSAVILSVYDRRVVLDPLKAIRWLGKQRA